MNVAAKIATAKVEYFKQFASNGRRIRIATRVCFADGSSVEFSERLSKREAIKQAAYHLPIDIRGNDGFAGFQK